MHNYSFQDFHKKVSVVNRLGRIAMSCYKIRGVHTRIRDLRIKYYNEPFLTGAKHAQWLAHWAWRELSIDMKMAARWLVHLYSTWLKRVSLLRCCCLSARLQAAYSCAVVGSHEYHSWLAKSNANHNFDVRIRSHSAIQGHIVLLIFIFHALGSLLL